MKIKKLFFLLIVIMLLLPIVYSETISIYVRPKSGTSLQPSTSFSYLFNFTSDNSCTNVLLNKNATITTDAYGIGFAELDVSELTSAPSFLCEYRDGTLRKVHNISGGLFKEIKSPGNLTIGSKITFALGELIDNIVDGIIKITGDLHIGSGSPTQTFNDSDVYVTGRIEAGNGLFGIAPLYGAGLLSVNHNFSLFAVHNTGDAEFNGTTKIVCDYINNPFNDSYENKFLTVSSSTPDYSYSTSVIDNFVNSSCIKINFGIGITETITDATNFNFTVYEHPVLAVFGNGLTRLKVSDNAQSRFHVYIPNGTSTSAVLIEDVCGADQHTPFLLDADVGNCAGYSSMSTLIHTTDNVVNQITDNLQLKVNLNNFSSGRYNALNVWADDCSNVECTALRISPGFNYTIKIGEDDSIAKAYYDVSGNIADGTAAFTSTSTDVTLFTAQNDYLYIGSTVNFTSIGIGLTTQASKTIIPEFYYCDSAGTWQTLTSVIDSTNGFINSGTLRFINPTDRGVCNKEFDGTVFAETTNYTYIAVKRTRATLVKKPVENLIDVRGSTKKMILKEDMLMLDPISTPPATCNADFKGAIYNDDDLNLPCYCDGTNWVQMDDFSSVCS